MFLHPQDSLQMAGLKGCPVGTEQGVLGGGQKRGALLRPNKGCFVGSEQGAVWWPNTWCFVGTKQMSCRGPRNGDFLGPKNAIGMKTMAFGTKIAGKRSRKSGKRSESFRGGRGGREAGHLLLYNFTTQKNQKIIQSLLLTTTGACSR